MRKSVWMGRRALSAAVLHEQAARWHGGDEDASARGMIRKLILLAAAAITAPLMAAPGGQIDTLLIGTYYCELPGDVTGPVGTRVPAEDFAVLNASSYEASGARGTYLLTGSIVTMTSGPKNGQRFRRQSSSFLRQLDADGQETTLRCVRRNGNSG